MPKSQVSKVQQLRNLADQPEEQASYALMLLNPRYGYEVVLSAIQWCIRTSHEAARPALLKLYAHYDEQGEERDPAANIRGAIIRALRATVQPADLPLLLKAVSTYVFPPPAFKEEGAVLRTAGLVALNEVDEQLARYHAVRLLANEHTDPMSGEPAISAVRLLASHEEMIPLYFYVMQDGARVLPEVVSECLRHLVLLPTPLVPSLVERYGSTTQDVILVGLFDLLINHKKSAAGREFLREFLQNSRRYDVYRYLVRAIIAGRSASLLNELLAIARNEQVGEKITILIDALSLLEAKPEIAQEVSNLRSRVGHRQGITPLKSTKMEDKLG